jgi:hypothetical protein
MLMGGGADSDLPRRGWCEAPKFDPKLKLSPNYSYKEFHKGGVAVFRQNVLQFVSCPPVLFYGLGLVGPLSYILLPDSTSNNPPPEAPPNRCPPAASLPGGPRPAFSLPPPPPPISAPAEASATSMLL